MNIKKGLTILKKDYKGIYIKDGFIYKGSCIFTCGVNKNAFRKKGIAGSFYLKVNRKGRVTNIPYTWILDEPIKNANLIKESIDNKQDINSYI